jgi:hypothetical protein
LLLLRIKGHLVVGEELAAGVLQAPAPMIGVSKIRNF